MFLAHSEQGSLWFSVIAHRIVLQFEDSDLAAARAEATDAAEPSESWAKLESRTSLSRWRTSLSGWSSGASAAEPTEPRFAPVMQVV